MPKGTENSQAKMTDAKILKLYAARLGGVDYNALGRRFKLDPSTVKAICEGRAWKHMLAHPDAPSLEALAAVPKNTRPSARITINMAREIKTRLAAGETGRCIAKVYGIHFGSVSDIKRGLTWRDA